MKRLLLLIACGFVSACGGTTTVFTTGPIVTDPSIAPSGNQGVSIVELNPDDVIVPIAPPSGAEASGDLNADFASLINDVRLETGAGALTFDARLGSAAQDYAQLMLDRNHFGHVGPDGSLFTERVAATGYQFSSLRENIAAGQPDVNTVFAAWQGSEGHRDNNLATDVEDFGLGFAQDGGNNRWVLILGSEG